MCMPCQSATVGKYFFFAVGTTIDWMIIGTDHIIDPKNTVCSGTWLGTFFVILVGLVHCDHNLATLETYNVWKLMNVCHQCLPKSVTHTVWHVWTWLPNLRNLQGSLRFICYCKGYKKRRFCLPSSNCSVCLWLWTRVVPYSYSTFVLIWLYDAQLRWFLWKCVSMGTYVVKDLFRRCCHIVEIYTLLTLLTLHLLDRLSGCTYSRWPLSPNFFLIHTMSLIIF